MADNKKSILLYTDIIHTVEKLTDDQAGKLFKHILRYVNDQNPETDIFTEIVFEPIRQNFKRDLQKWNKGSEARISRAKKAGLASAKARQLKSTKSTKSNSVVKNELSSTKSTVNGNGNVNVSGNVNVITKQGGGSAEPHAPVDYDKLVNFYNSTCTGLSKVEVISKTRKDLMRMRNKEHGGNAIKTVLEKSSASNFLNGENDRGWKANFDWIFNSRNFIKILEGYHDNKKIDNPKNKKDAATIIQEKYGLR